MLNPYIWLCVLGEVVNYTCIFIIRLVEIFQDSEIQDNRHLLASNESSESLLSLLKKFPSHFGETEIFQFL